MTFPCIEYSYYRGVSFVFSPENSWSPGQSELASGDKTFIGRTIHAVISKGIVVISHGEREMGKRILKESRDFQGE